MNNKKKFLLAGLGVCVVILAAVIVVQSFVIQPPPPSSWRSCLRVNTIRRSGAGIILSNMKAIGRTRMTPSPTGFGGSVNEQKSIKGPEIS